MIRKKKLYAKPRKAHDIARASEEEAILKKYGLKNRKEIWKADSRISNIRNRAKELITQGREEQERLISKMARHGFNVKKISDILALTKEDVLERRLQTIVAKKRMAKTPRAARQLITHKHVLVGNSIVNIPSYPVSLEEEKNISVRLKPQGAGNEVGEKK